LVLLLARGIFNHKFFVEKVLASFDKEQTYNWLANWSKSVFFHFDKTTSHRAPRDFDCLGIIKFLYPPYNPDLALCGFWLLGTVKRRLKGYMFEDPVEVMTAVSTFLNKILLDVFISVFDE
jgi:hypothetical protein